MRESLPSPVLGVLGPVSAACNLKGLLLGLIVGGTGFGEDIADIYMNVPFVRQPPTRCSAL